MIKHGYAHKRNLAHKSGARSLGSVLKSQSHSVVNVINIKSQYSEAQRAAITNA
jgi:hypothetical protein